MQVIAGDRAVTIRMSYEDADSIIAVGESSAWKIFQEIARNLKSKVNEAREKGRPLPPLPKGQVAHNSPVEIVEPPSR